MVKRPVSSTARSGGVPSGRLRLGLDTYSYHFSAPIWGSRPAEPLTLEGYLDRAAELGVDGLALADMRHFTSTDEPTIAALKARAERHGLYVELGTGGVDVAHLRSCLQLARRFGGRALRTFVSIGKTWGDPSGSPEALRRAAAALRQAAEACEQTSVALAVENHQDLTGAELAELLTEVDHPLVGACWDSGNSLGVLEHPLEGLAAVARRTFTVHLKSYAVVPRRDGGYVLVAVPVEHNRELLRQTLRTLVEQSPAEELHINVEAAVERIPVTPARAGWRGEHAEAARRILTSFAPTPGADIQEWIPRKDMSLEELQRLEDRLVRRSVAQARQLLAEFRR